MARKIYNRKETVRKSYAADSIRTRKAKEARQAGDYSRAQEIFNTIDYIFSNEEVDLNKATSVINYKLSTGEPRVESTKLTELLTRLHSDNYYYASGQNIKYGPNVAIEQAIDFNNKINYTQQGVMTFASYTDVVQSYDTLKTMKDSGKGYLYLFDTETIGGTNTSNIWNPLDITEFAMQKVDLATNDVTKTNVVMGLDDTVENKRMVEKILNALGDTLNDPELGDVKLTNDKNIIMNDEELRVTAYRLGLYGDYETKFQFNDKKGYMEAVSLADGDMNDWLDPEKIKRGWQRNVEAHKMSPMTQYGFNMADKTFIDSMSEMYNAANNKTGIIGGQNIVPFDFKVVNTKIARMRKNLQEIKDMGGNATVSAKMAEEGLAYLDKAFGGNIGFSAPSSQIYDTLPMINFIKDTFGINALYNNDQEAIMKAANGLAKQENIGAVWFPEFFKNAQAHMADFDVDVQRMLFTTPIESLGNKTFMEHFMEVEQGGGLKNLNMKVQKIKAGNQDMVFYAKKGTRDRTFTGKSALDHTYNSRTGEIFFGSNYEIMGPNQKPKFNGDINMGTHINKGNFYYLDSVKKINAKDLPKELADTLPELAGNEVFQVRMHMAVSDKHKGKGLEDLEYVFHFGSEYEMSGWFSSNWDIPLVKDKDGKYVINSDNALDLLEQVKIKDGQLERDPGFYLQTPDQMFEAALESKNEKVLTDRVLREYGDSDKYFNKIGTQLELRKTLKAAGLEDVTDEEIASLLRGTPIERMKNMKSRDQHNLLAKLKKVAGFKPNGQGESKIYSNTINKIATAWNFVGMQDEFYMNVFDNLEKQGNARKWTHEQRKVMFDRVVENLKAQVAEGMEDLSAEELKNLVYNSKSFEGSFHDINKIYDIQLPEDFKVDLPRRKKVITGSNIDAAEDILTVRWGDKSSPFELIKQVTKAKYADKDLSQNLELYQRQAMYKFTEHLRTLDDFKDNELIEEAWKHMNADTKKYNLVSVSDNIIQAMKDVKAADPTKGILKEINVRDLSINPEYFKKLNAIPNSQIIDTINNTAVPLDLTGIKRGKKKKYLESYIKNNLLDKYLPSRAEFEKTLIGLTDDQISLKRTLYDTVEKQITGSLVEITDALSSVPDSDLSILPDGRFAFTKAGETVTVDSLPRIKLDGDTLYGMVDKSPVQLHLEMATNNKGGIYMTTNLGEAYNKNITVARAIKKQVKDKTFTVDSVYSITSHLTKEFREDSRYEFKSGDWFSNYYVGTGAVDEMLPRLFSEDGDLYHIGKNISIPDEVKAVLKEQFKNPDMEIEAGKLNPVLNQYLVDYRVEIARELARMQGDQTTRDITAGLTIGTKGKGKLEHGKLMGANMRFEVGATNGYDNLGRPVVDGAGNVKFIRSNQIDDAIKAVQGNFYEGALLETNQTRRINRRNLDAVGDVVTGWTGRTLYVGEMGIKTILENNFDKVMANNNVKRLTDKQKKNIYDMMFAYVNTFEQQKIIDARAFDAVTGGGTMAANTIKLSSAKDFVNIVKDEKHLDKYERLLNLMGDIEMTPEGVINYKSATGQIVKRGETVIPYATFGGSQANWTSKMDRGLLTFQVTNDQKVRLSDEEISIVLNRHKDLFEGIDFSKAKDDLETRGKILNAMRRALGDDFELNFAIEDINRIQLPKILVNDSEKSMNALLHAKTGTIDERVAKMFSFYGEETKELLQGTVLTPQALEAAFPDASRRKLALKHAGFSNWNKFVEAWENEMYSMRDLLFGKGGIFEGFTDIANDNLLGHENRGTMMIGSIDEATSMLGKYLSGGGKETLASKQAGIKEFVDRYNSDENFKFFKDSQGKGIELEYKDGRMMLKNGQGFRGGLETSDDIDQKALERLIRNIDETLEASGAKQEDRLVHHVIKNDDGKWISVAKGTEGSQEIVGRMNYSTNKKGEKTIEGSILSLYHKIVNDPETQSSMPQEYFDTKVEYMKRKGEKINLEHQMEALEKEFKETGYVDPDHYNDLKSKLVQAEIDLAEMDEYLTNMEDTGHAYRIGDQEEKIIKNYFLNKTSFAALEDRVAQGHVKQEAIDAMESLRGLNRASYEEKAKLVYGDFLDELYQQQYYDRHRDTRKLTKKMVNERDEYKHLKGIFEEIMGEDGQGRVEVKGKKVKALGVETAQTYFDLHMAELAESFNNGGLNIEKLTNINPDVPAANFKIMTPDEYLSFFGDPDVPGYDDVIKDNVILEFDMGKGRGKEYVAVPGMGSVLEKAERRQDWHVYASRMAKKYQTDFLNAHGNPLELDKIVEQMDELKVQLKESTSDFVKKGSLFHDTTKLEVHAAVDRIKIMSTMNDPNNPLLKQAMIDGKSLAEWTQEGVYHDYAFDSLESFQKRGYFNKEFLDSMGMTREEMIEHLRTQGTIMIDDRYPNIRERSLTPVRHYLAIDDQGMSFLASNATMMAPHTMLAMNADSDGDSVSRFLVRHKGVDHVQYSVARNKAIAAVDAAGGYADDTERESLIRTQTLSRMETMGIKGKRAKEAYDVFREREANMSVLAASQNIDWFNDVKETWKGDYGKTKQVGSIIDNGVYSGAEVQGGKSLFGYKTFNALTETPTWAQVNDNLKTVNTMLATVQSNADLLSEETKEYAKDLLEGSNDIFQHNNEAKVMDQALVAYKELMGTTANVTQEGFDDMQQAAIDRLRINKYHIEGMKKLGVTATGNVNSSLYGLSQAVKAHYGDATKPMYDEIMRSITSEMSYLLEETPISGKKYEIKAGDTRLIEFGDLFRKIESSGHGLTDETREAMENYFKKYMNHKQIFAAYHSTMEKAGVPMAERLQDVSSVVNTMVSEYTTIIGQVLDPTNPMYQDYVAHRELGRKNARAGSISKVAGKLNSDSTILGRAVGNVSGMHTTEIPEKIVHESMEATSKKIASEFEPPEVNIPEKKIAEAIESGSNKIAKSIMNSSGGLKKSLGLGVMGLAAGLIASGYASGNPLNDPDPATIDQKNYEGVKAAPEMMFSSGQGFASNNTGGYIINIKGDTRKGNRQLKKALKQATRNAIGPGSINMNVKLNQSSGAYSDQDIENILNNYF